MFLGILVYLLSIKLFIADYVKDKRILSFLPLIVGTTVLLNPFNASNVIFYSYFPGNSPTGHFTQCFIPLFLYALLKYKKVLILLSFSIFSFIHPTYALISTLIYFFHLIIVTRTSPFLSACFPLLILIVYLLYNLEGSNSLDSDLFNAYVELRNLGHIKPWIFPYFWINILISTVCFCMFQKFKKRV